MKFLSPSCFGIVIIFFFFPFIDLKCNDIELANLKGIELVTGSEIKTKDIHLPPISKDESKEHSFNIDGQAIDRNYFAVAAFLLAIGGLVLSFLMQRKKEIFTGIIGFAGGLSLLLMRLQVDNSIAKETEGMSKYIVHTDYVYGYWLSLAFFFIAGAINISTFIDAQQEALRNQEKSTDGS